MVTDIFRSTVVNRTQAKHIGVGPRSVPSKSMAAKVVDLDYRTSPVDTDSNGVVGHAINSSGGEYLGSRSTLNRLQSCSRF
jgi:hypothetical protein